MRPIELNFDSPAIIMIVMQTSEWTYSTTDKDLMVCEWYGEVLSEGTADL